MHRHSGVAATGDTVPTGDLARIAAPDFVWDLQISTRELHQLLKLAARVKEKPGDYRQALTGRYLSLLFEKPSLRTRVTFELAIKQLGGDSILSTSTVGEREPLKDVARNLDRWTNAIVLRTFHQSKIESLAEWSSVPVINALSDKYHPCQALADVFTILEEFGDAPALKCAFVGDGNNVMHSLLLTAPRCGISVSVATPSGFEPDPDVVARAKDLAAASGAKIEVTTDAAAAVEGAHVVYTDVWTSMGKEEEADHRARIFQPFQVTTELIRKARPESIFLHCLPAKRGEEVTDEVVECPQSRVFTQAENRLHTQKALLLMLL